MVGRGHRTDHAHYTSEASTSGQVLVGHAARVALFQRRRPVAGRLPPAPTCTPKVRGVVKGVTAPLTGSTRPRPGDRIIVAVDRGRMSALVAG